ncbi:hypothetical protein BBK36DRAFT_1143515 [Trichoderma citrinoviride]|uniref:Carboxylesterase family protein n=1 Tax=Trichoderma citrinoviride TaxID=58853 RepID=A0A2T4B3A3_9HYPO|nr:hypothetical protein BBK36DRAFT_1143515 [Trichoderma citrinoviride]PTB63807.1 hypothetical protein BBK36DRAFT_1143515 [Trichoderma citrinoviride]
MRRRNVTPLSVAEGNGFDAVHNRGTFDVRFGADIFQRAALPAASSRDTYEKLPPHFKPKQITTRKRNLAGDSVVQGPRGPCPGQRHGQGQCRPSDVAMTSERKGHGMTTSPSALHRAARQASPKFRRRPAIDSETFQPLDSLREASALAVNKHNYENTGPPSTRASQERFAEVYDLLKDTVAEGSLWEQVKRHSAGQFEWLMTHLPSNNSSIHDSSSEEYAAEHGEGDKAYVCNLVLQKKRGPHSDSECPLNSYYLLATPLQYSANWTVEMQEPRIAGEDDSVTWMDNSHPGTPPMKVPEIVLAVESAVSPTFTAVSDRSFGESSSRATSFSLPRIEDSLEELDRLEDQLEALNEYTSPRQLALVTRPQHPKAVASQQTPEEAMRAMKRSMAACTPATVRVKPTEKVSATPRRSFSLTARERSPEQPVKGSSSHRSGLGVFMSKAGNTLATVAKSSIRSSKAPTIPSFELPARDTREAHHAAAAKALEAPPKPRSNMPQSKSTFELPGDTISRRKREEMEAKLRAEEEEQRKRREFKARPAKPASTPSTLPRDTVASRARQAKIQEEAAQRQAASAQKVKRLSLGLVRDEPTTPTVSKAEKSRFRGSMMAAAESINRSILSSMVGAARSKNPLSIESMATRLRPRPKEIQDSATLKEKKSHEKLDRPMTAKAARDEAAERSRMASREWAERKRRKEAASMKQITGQ